MKNLSRTSWALLVALIFMTGFIYSCKDDDDNNTNDGKTDPNTIAASSLIAYFPFDVEPAAGSAVEFSNNTITYVRKVGNAAFVDGRRGNAYQGNTSQSYLEYNVAAGSPFSTLDEITLACWIKTPVTTTGAAKIFTINGGDILMGNVSLIQESQATGDSVDMKFYIFDSASQLWKGQDIRKNLTEFVNDKWFHLVAIYRKSTSTLEFWANGVKVFEDVRYEAGAEVNPRPLLEDITLGPGITKLYFGTWPQLLDGTQQDWMTYYKGIVDEFRIYKKALTAEEVKALYDAEVSQLNP